MTNQYLSKLAKDDCEIERARRQYHAKSVLDVTEFILPETIEEVRSEVNQLRGTHSARRDLTVPTTGHTPRRMTNVRSDQILANSHFLTQLYASKEILGLVSRIADEEAFPCPYEAEKMVITSLAKKGDSHGWHWDDYSFALIWVLEAPEAEMGGVVQCVPNTRWNRDNPNIIDQFVTQEISTYYFPEKSVYLMKSNTTLHRVYPIQAPGVTRTILNSTYANQSDLTMEVDHSSMEQLFSPAM